MGQEITTNLTERQKYAARIRAEMSGTVQSIIETGRTLCEAKAKLKQGEWKLMVENDLPFARQTAFRLMAITHDPRLADVTHVQHLPPHWGTLYQLSQLHDDEFERGISEGVIRADMKRSDVRKLHAVPGHTVEPDPEPPKAGESRDWKAQLCEAPLKTVCSLCEWDGAHAGPCPPSRTRCPVVGYISRYTEDADNGLITLAVRDSKAFTRLSEALDGVEGIAVIKADK